MRVLVKVMGGGEIGLGHVRRSMELFALASGRGWNVRFHCYDHPTVRDLLADVPHSVADLDSRLVEVVPNVVLWDQRDTPVGEIARIRALAGCPILALDYFRYDDSAVDRVLNLYHHERQSLATAEHPERFREGLDLAIVRREFAPFRQRATVCPSVSRVLVTFGGSDPSGHTATAIAALAEAGYGAASLDVVLGPDAVLPRSALEPWAGPSQVSRAVDDMPRRMAEADLACTGGGTTLLEACYLGLPCVVFPQTERERAHAVSVAAQGAARCVDNGTAPVQALTALAGEQARRELSASAQHLVDGRGAERILQELTLLAGRH